MTDRHADVSAQRSPSLAAFDSASGLARTAAVRHAAHPRQAARRLVIKNAMVIYGNAKPPYGPVDIVVEDGLISYIGPADAVSSCRSRFRPRRDRRMR